MTTPELVMALAAGLCLVGTRWNATAAALAGSFAVVRLTYAWTGEEPGFAASVFLDTAVIAVVYMKPHAFPRESYFGLAHQVACFLLELSLWDRLVILCFPLMWATHLLVSDPWLSWWSLWWIAMAQFVAALIEAEDRSRIRRSAKVADPSDNPSSGMAFALLRGSGGYG